MKAQIVPLFSVPVLYIFESDRFLSQSEKQIIDSLSVLDNPNNLSENRFILDLPGLENLKEFCQLQIDTYAKDICNVTDSFYITNSWTTKNMLGTEHPVHNHPNSIFSGVYYIEAEENCSPLMLHHNTPIFKDFNLEYHYKDYSIFNSNSWSFPVKTGTLIIFPSWVQHSSPANTSYIPRRLIGFNSFVRGTFGDFNYCSDLKLS